MSLLDLFEPSLQGLADETGLEWGDTAIRFGEIDARSNRVANLLREKGFEPGDRLAAQIANAPDVVDLYLGCLKAGVVYLPVNILYRERELEHVIRDAEPRAFISTQELPGDVERWDPSRVATEAAACNAERTDHVATDDDVAMIVYTSGTTGDAKGVMLTHRNLEANARTLVAAWEIARSDRFLLALPLFHVHGLGNGLHTWLATGMRTRLLERFDHRTIGDEMLRFEPTLFFGVPTMYARLLALGENDARTIGAKARLFVSGSAPLSPDVFDRFAKKFGHRILERYGMTETLMTLSHPLRGDRLPGTVGSPLPGVDAEIRDADGKRVATDDTGELFVRGANVFAGYWNRPEATSAAFDGDWFRTGDLASRNGDGRYTLHGRTSEMINSGGFKILPREIEEFLAAQEGVEDVAVVGIADPIRGEIPVAFLRPGAAYDPASLQEACARTFASFKVPKRWIEVEALPRNALGKVKKNELRHSLERERS